MKKPEEMTLDELFEEAQAHYFDEDRYCLEYDSYGRGWRMRGHSEITKGYPIIYDVSLKDLMTYMIKVKRRKCF